MTRDSYKTVTVPILIYASEGKAQGSATFLPGFEGLRPVRLFRNNETKEFWQSIGTRERQEFCAIVQLLGAVKKHDSLAARNASASLAKSDSPELEKIVLQVAERFKSYPQSKLDEVISERLKAARLVVWNRKGKPVLAIFCPDNVTALFAKALLVRVSGRGLAVCPQCGVPFVQKRPNQDYCSIQHREAHRVARWRASRTTSATK